MNQRIILLLLFIFAFVSKEAIFSQSTIKGMVKDTLNDPLVAATVILLNAVDSTLVKFDRTTLDGSFKIKDVADGSYLLKTTYLGYIPTHTPVTIKGEKKLDIPTIRMVEMASELMEVVLRAAKAPMKIKGDTIEYDASTFKVPEGSTVEDLLRRLPGIEIDNSGELSSEGQKISKVTVDGKSFFGSDPKAATKNLPAEGISKIQVFDKETEQSKITGNKSDSDEKTMNLELKEDFKSGGFGRVVAAYGTRNRAELKGNYNRFNSKIQFSLVGVGNNTGRNGLGWNDMQDFMGSQGFNFDNDGEYGFSSGGDMFIIFSSSALNLESSISSVFFNGNRSGLPQNLNTGVNFTFEDDKRKFSSMYFFNRSILYKESLLDQIKIQPTFTISEQKQSIGTDKSNGHRAEMEYEHELDSLHTLKFSANGAYINELNMSADTLELTNNKILKTRSFNNNMSRVNGFLGSGKMIFRKKFKKKGRRMGYNNSFSYSELKHAEVQAFKNTFFKDNEPDTIDDQKRQTNNNGRKTVFTANALYVEPILKSLTSETFGNYSIIDEKGRRTVEDKATNALNPDLSRDYANKIQKTRIGSSLRYSLKGSYISVGAAYLRYDLGGKYVGLVNNQNSYEIQKPYVNFVPNINIGYSPVRSFYNNFSYGISVSAPSLSDIQPIVNNSNPLYIVEGNPDLQPKRNHFISLRSRKSFIESGIRLNGYVRFSKIITDIINSETVTENLITYVKPINFDEGQSISGRFGYAMPIVKNKLKFDLGMSLNQSNSFAQVNNVLNERNTTRFSPYGGIEFTPTDKISITLDFWSSIEHTKYSLANTQNQKVQNYNIDLELNTVLFAGIYLSSDFGYDYYFNDRYNISQTIPLLNASIYRFFLPNNQLEVRLSLYDAFNQNKSISQFATPYGFRSSKTNRLARYGIISLTYNIKGLKSDLDNNNFF